MASAPVDIPVKVKGLSDLEKLARRMTALEREVTRLQGKLPKAANGIRATGVAARGAAGGVGAFGASLKAALGPIAAAAGAIGGLTAGFKEISNFNFSSAKVKSLGVDIAALKTELKSVGQELGGSRSQAELLAASYNVASSGFRNTADAAAVLKAASLGASGGFATLESTASATTAVLNAYGLSASEAGKTVDQFVQTQNDGVIVVAEYAQGIGKVASAAAGLKIPLSEVNAAIAQSTKAGVLSDVAFTGLKVALSRLASGEAAKAIEDTGIELTAASLEADGLAGTLRKLEGLDVGQIFRALGAEAGPALLPVLNNLDEFERLIKNQEAAVNTAKNAQVIAADTIQGAWARVGNAFSDAFTSQEGVAESLVPILDAVAGAVRALSTPLGKTIVQVGLLVAGFVALNAALVALKATAIVAWVQRLIPILIAGKGALLGNVVATKALTVATAQLNTVALLNPWVALAAGLTAVGVAAFNASQKINDMRAKMNDLSGSSSEIKGRMGELQAEIDRLEGKLDGAGNSARGMKRKIDELKAALDNLSGQYDVIINLETRGFTFDSAGNTSSYEVGGIKYDAKTGRAINPPKTVTQQLEEKRTSAVTPSGSSSGGGGGGAAPRESELPQLQRQLQVSDKLLQIDRARLEAQFNGNEKEIQRLANLRVMTELEGKRAEIAAEEIPVAEQKVKEQLAENEAALAGLEIKYQGLELEKQRQEAVQGIIAPLGEEIQLLQARINGNEEEIKQNLEILRIKKAIKEADPNADTSGVAAMVKQRDALTKFAEKQEEAKAKAEELAGAISGALTESLRGLVTGSMTAEQALSNAFQGIADAFLDMAMKMIEEWIKMQVIGLIGGLLSPGAAPALGGGGLGAGSFNLSGGQFGSFAGGGYTGDGPRSGGVDGKGGFPAILHPQESVIDHFDDAHGAMGGGGSGNPDSSDGLEAARSKAFAQNSNSITNSTSVMRERERNSETTIGGAGSMIVETQVINNVEYATVEQMRQASAASAKKARADVFSDMKNRPSTRRQVGMR